MRRGERRLALALAPSSRGCLHGPLGLPLTEYGESTPWDRLEGLGRNCPSGCELLPCGLYPQRILIHILWAFAENAACTILIVQGLQEGSQIEV